MAMTWPENRKGWPRKTRQFQDSTASPFIPGETPIAGGPQALPTAGSFCCSGGGHFCSTQWNHGQRHGCDLLLPKTAGGYGGRSLEPSSHPAHSNNLEVLWIPDAQLNISQSCPQLHHHCDSSGSGPVTSPRPGPSPPHPSNINPSSIFLCLKIVQDPSSSHCLRVKT